MKRQSKKASRKTTSVARRSLSISGVADAASDPRDIPAITNLWVCGWKSLQRNIPIELRRLTVLAGANSSGKSSLFQPILMLKQTLEAPYDPGALLLDGPHVRFTEASQFFSHHDDAGNFSDLVIGLQTQNDLVETTYSKSSGMPIKVVQEKLGRGLNQLVIRPEMSPSDVKKQLGKEGDAFLSLFSKNATSVEVSVTRNRCFLAVQLNVDRGSGQKFSLSLDSGGTGEVVRAIRSIIHLPGLRGNPERTYPLNATEGLYPGQFQSYTASLIQRWKETSNSIKLQELNEALTSLGLTSEITTASVDETRVEIKVGRMLGSECNEYVSIADVGLAVSQVLPVLVALVVAKPGQLVFVEQPELHLHPRAQIKLATIMAGAIKRGVRILMETHSSLLLLGIQTAVADGSLDHEDIGLNWFTRDESGVTCVTRSEIDSAGAFGDWPEDFADVSFEAETIYLKAAEKVLRAEQNAG